MCLRVVIRKNMFNKLFFASLKSLKKGVGSGFISQRYGSADPDPHQHVTDPQHCLLQYLRLASPMRPFKAGSSRRPRTLFL
jgi:hypothetical protein